MSGQGAHGADQWNQDSLKDLAAQKEHEWRQVQHLRSEVLEAALKDKDKTLLEEKTKFQKLKEDFKYNLRLLNERDAELEKYDSTFRDVKSKIGQKEAEISELKIRIDEQSTAASHEVMAREEIQSHYQQRIREKQLVMDKYRCDKDAEIQAERIDLEVFKRNLERQLRESEQELEVQRRELTAGYEEAMKKREHEFRVQADEMSTTMLAHEIKVKLLTKELEVLASAHTETTKEVDNVEENHRILEKQLKHKQWQLDDLKAMKDARISELEGKLQHLEMNMKKSDENYQRKHVELDRLIKEKEATILKVRDSSQEREHHLQEQIRSMQTVVEEAELKLRQAEWTVQDVQKEKETIVERMENELIDIKSRWESHISEISRSNVDRDVELETLRESVGQLNTELSQRKQDIDRYKRELNESMDREATLERSKTQLDLDWQRRYEGVEREQYDRAEDLVKNLTQARDQVGSELKEKRRELSHMQDVLKLLTKERDLAMATLTQHGIRLDNNINVEKWQNSPESQSEQMVQFEEQNEHLRQVIRQMRQEMEQLGDTLPGSSTARSSKGEKLVANEYVKNLEEELHKVKVKCRQMQQQADDTPGSKVNNEDQDKILEAAADNMFVRNHIEQLNNAIGGLRTEKVELTTQLRKQQARLQYVETALDQAAKQPREKEARVQQLEYELSAASRRHDAEVASLKGRVGELQLQLAEVRREADEYHKSNIEQNLEITAIRNQLSHAKLELAEGRPAVNFGAQELMIQQLQDEIKHLRQIQKGEESITDVLTFEPKLGQGHGLTTNAMVAQLQQKLRAAAKHIQQLAKDKQQLIEMGNRLRAELKHSGLQPSSAPKTVQPGVVLQQKPYNQVNTGSGSFLQQKIQDKLQQLEQLQYELTKQELAQKQAKLSTRYIPPVQLVSSSTESEEDKEYRPTSILKKSDVHPGGITKLSPVPENAVSYGRPRTAPDVLTLSQNDEPPRPHTGYTNNMPTNHRTSSPSREPIPAGLLASVSSIGGGESIQEIWRMLDEEGGSPRSFTPLGGSGPFQGLQFPGDVQYSRPKSAESLILRGKKPVIEQKNKTYQDKKLSDKISGKVGAIKIPQKSKIRNYNLKDNT